jgi:hypothetical protein
MTGSKVCVAADRLAALALAAHAPEGEHDREVLDHVSRCHTCANSLADLTREFDALRASAWHEVDAKFDEVALETQRTKILDKLAHLGQAARVLRFPARTREAAMPVSPISRRWLSVAAAAGLLIGLVAGQLIHFVPWDTRLHRTATPQLQTVATASRGQAGPVLVQHASSGPLGADDDLLDEIDEAMELRRAAQLRALDAFTPRVGEQLEIR